MNYNCLLTICFICILGLASSTHAQSPTPTPSPNDRGLGVKSSASAAGTQGDQQAKEAKPELVLQTGYSDLYGATRLVFSPDGRLLATTTFRAGAIKLWETASSRKLREFPTGNATANNLAPPVAFSRDNRFIASAGGDNTTKVWDVSTGREVQTLAGPQGSIAASFGVFFIAFTPDNRVVTVGDAVRVWDLSTGKELRTIEGSALSLNGFNGSEGAIVLTPDGSQLSLSTSEEIRSVDLSTGKEVRSLKMPDDQVDSLQLGFNANGNLLAAGIVNKHLKLWNLTTKSSKDLTPTLKEFSQVKFSRDGQLLSLAENYTVRIWNTETGNEVIQLKVPNSGVYSEYADAFSTFSDDGKKIATGGFGTETIIWETETGKQLSRMNGRTNLAYNVRFSDDGNQLSVGGRTRWDLRTGRGLRVTSNLQRNVYPIQSPDSRLLAVIKP